jgi:hypothetical protein
LNSSSLLWKYRNKRALGHPGAGGYFFGPGGGKAFFYKQVQRRIQQFAGPRFFAPLALGRRGIRSGRESWTRDMKSLMTDWLVM